MKKVNDGIIRRIVGAASGILAVFALIGATAEPVVAQQRGFGEMQQRAARGMWQQDGGALAGGVRQQGRRARPDAAHRQGRRAHPDAVQSWQQAARLQTELSENEKAELLDRAERAAPVRGIRNGARFARSERGIRGNGKGARGLRNGGSNAQRVRGLRNGTRGQWNRLGLNDEQLSQARQIQAAHVEERVSIQEAFRNGEISRDDARSRMESLHSTIQAEIGGLLTPEQREVQAGLEAEREAVRAGRNAEVSLRRVQKMDAMAGALELSEGQRSDLEALIERHRSDRVGVLDEARAAGNPEAAREMFENMRARHEADLESILDESQMETFRIHQAIAGRANARGFRPNRIR